MILNLHVKTQMNSVKHFSPKFSRSPLSQHLIHKLKKSTISDVKKTNSVEGTLFEYEFKYCLGNKYMK